MLKAKQSNADALFVYTNEEESARALRELRKQGYDKPIIGETTLTGQKVIELAGDAANGAIAHVGLTADAPQPAIKAFDDKFQKEYKYKSDHNGMKGYSGMYVVKAVTEKNGQVRLARRSRKAMHGAKISVKEYPGVLLDVTFDQQRRPRPRELPGQGRERQAGRHRDAAAGRQVTHATRATGETSLRFAPRDGAALRVMGDFIQLIVSGTATGAIYALAALGFTLLWQAAGVINFAQGEFVMLPAFAMLFCIAVGAPLWLAFLLTCALSMLVLGLRLQAGDRRSADQATA